MIRGSSRGDDQQLIMITRSSRPRAVPPRAPQRRSSWSYHPPPAGRDSTHPPRSARGLAVPSPRRACRPRRAPRGWRRAFAAPASCAAWGQPQTPRDSSVVAQRLFWRWNSLLVAACSESAQSRQRFPLPSPVSQWQKSWREQAALFIGAERAQCGWHIFHTHMYMGMYMSTCVHTHCIHVYAASLSLCVCVCPRVCVCVFLCESPATCSTCSCFLLWVPRLMSLRFRMPLRVNMGWKKPIVRSRLCSWWEVLRHSRHLSSSLSDRIRCAATSTFVCACVSFGLVSRVHAFRRHGKHVRARMRSSKTMRILLRGYSFARSLPYSNLWTLPRGVWTSLESVDVQLPDERAQVIVLEVEREHVLRTRHERSSNSIHLG